ncbi:MAG: DNA-deoxyinosine glycosylase [Gracilibacteraceae bacterium]|jgi:hypoxanthine-DNA glycosylase|nr:DNA-deoxyinosine glycosylase [Gracilibacteraceae bacterium]
MSIVVHPWEPVCDARSRVLILGTIPSPKSREGGFYYGHPQNSFWTVLARVLGERAPDGIAAKKEFLLRSRVALWDVLHSCEINGAADSSIQNPVVNRFQPLLAQTDIRSIFTTGQKATALFNRYCRAEAGTAAIYLPSTSPANRAGQAGPDFLAQWLQVKAALTEAARESIRIDGNFA